MAAKAAEQKRGHTLSFPKWPLRAGSPLDAPEHRPHWIVSINSLRHFCIDRLFYRINERIVRFNEPMKELCCLLVSIFST
jgi:hypothetical protein